MKTLSPSKAITFNSIGIAAVVTYSIVLLSASPFDKDEVQLWGGLLTLLVCVPGIILATILHYRCWKAIPADMARTTPGKAAGLLFVPFFNFYWYFVSYLGLAEDAAKARGIPAGGRGLAIALGILSITCWSFGDSDVEILLLIPVTVAHFVVWLVYTLKMVAGANDLLGKESPQAPESVSIAAPHP